MSARPRLALGPLVLLPLALLALARCAVNPVTGERELMLVSESEELALARQARPALTWQDGGPLLIDEATSAYLAGIVGRLHAVSHRPGLPVGFTLHSSSVPNAWAIPGHTAMHRGLLQALENEAQFAFVMGHELGHVAARHSARRQTYGLLGGVLLGAGGALAGEGTLAQIAVGAAGLGTGLALLRYDRGQELQADELGALYIARAGYDPREAVRAHEVLRRAVDDYLGNLGKRREAPGPAGELFSTHPRHEVRVDELGRLVAQLPPAEARIEGDGRFAERWSARTAGIRALAPAYARYDRARAALGEDRLPAAEAELTEALRLAEQPQFWALRGAMLARAGRVPEAEQAYARALALHPGYQPALHALGALRLRQGRAAEAVPDLERSLAFRPGFLPSEEALGDALSRVGRPEGAVAHWEALARAAPRHPHVHGWLAREHERLGDRRAALGAWQAQLRVAPDSELGREARRRVRLLGADVTEPLASRAAHVRLARPLLWDVKQDHAFRRGAGELVLRRSDPEMSLRVTFTDYGGAQDARVRLEQWIEDRYRGARVTGERSARLGGHAAPARSIERGGVEHLVAAYARGGRVWWVEVSGPRDAWRDSGVREEVQRLLDSLEF